jgi:hypothetical protein
VEVHCDEGVANHIGPEPCAGIREDAGEASAGDRIGQPLSREIGLILGADAVLLAEGNTNGRAIASARQAQRGRRPWHVRTLLVWEPGDLMTDQRWLAAPGPHREGEEPKPVMHGHEKSDSAIVAKKPPNKAGQPAAEAVEQRAGTKGNTDQQNTRRTQIRGSVYQALERMRKAARHVCLAPCR